MQCKIDLLWSSSFHLVLVKQRKTLVTLIRIIWLSSVLYFLIKLNTKFYQTFKLNQITISDKVKTFKVYSCFVTFYSCFVLLVILHVVNSISKIMFRKYNLPIYWFSKCYLIPLALKISAYSTYIDTVQLERNFLVKPLSNITIGLKINCTHRKQKFC